MTQPTQSITMAHATVESGEGISQLIRVGKHHLTSDEAPAHGGQDTGPNPFQLLLASLGACTAITLQMYAGRKQWPLEKLTVRLVYRREPEGDRVERTLSCENPLTDEQRTRLLAVAAKTPVTLVLLRAMRIETQFA